ncbi:type I-E CRISPR-associated protein Cas5/CasD [Leptospira koniambonensis]|uniref:Type I-E CRISPR-associated protein Cas5/CasD n=1 Tax=Leptospira koniambonensis TaxID=2484950 RepID=A0A4R9J9I6_9LEPT|nr:type I-E CRISPR-associated protein Cas5/CasD [Leptospira koniambonensis]TGL35340.1 type I-E CRISPR-associated protein Cas5/CasD [Leptospira koniambonensis]
MNEYLIFRLYGPLSSWGDIATGENRHSFSYPSKSAITGLIAAALGIKREEEEKHLELSDSINFGVKVWSRGTLLRDYHTIQTPPNKGKITYSTRKDELREKAELNTILSSRDYYTDALYDVSVWKRKGSLLLNEMEEALKSPRFPLYLGRKSCVIASPLFQQLVIAENLFVAFSTFEQNLKEKFEKSKVPYFYDLTSFQNEITEYIWENESEAESHQILTRRDTVLSRKRWQFGERKEFYKSEKLLTSL